MRDLESTLRGTFADRYKRELSSSKSLGSTRSLSSSSLARQGSFKMSLSGSFSRRDASTHVPEKRMADLSLLAPQLAMTGSSHATSRSLEPRVSPGLVPEVLRPGRGASTPGEVPQPGRGASSEWVGEVRF